MKIYITHIYLSTKFLILSLPSLYLISYTRLIYPKFLNALIFIYSGFNFLLVVPTTFCSTKTKDQQ